MFGFIYTINAKLNIMKKVSFLVILFILITIQANSQAHNIQFPENEIHGTGIPMEHEKNYIEGTRNLNDDFKPGTIYYKKDGKIFQVPLRLNLYNDVFEYIKKEYGKNYKGKWGFCENSNSLF